MTLQTPRRLASDAEQTRRRAYFETMKSHIQTDEHGQYFACGMCLGDHGDDMAAAERCCSLLVMPDLDAEFDLIGRRQNPLTDKQIADQSRAIISRESFYKRKSY